MDAARVWLGIGIVVRIHVNQFDNEIGVGAGGRDAQHRRDRAGDGEVVFQWLGFVSEHVGAPGGESLVVCHVIAGHALADFARHRHRFGRVADVFVEFLLRR